MTHEPTTEAGRTMLSALSELDKANGETVPVDWAHGIRAVENEAEATLAARVKELEEALRDTVRLAWGGIQALHDEGAHSMCDGATLKVQAAERLLANSSSTEDPKDAQIAALRVTFGVNDYDDVWLKVGDRCIMHLEQMDAGTWYLGIYADDGDRQLDLRLDKRTIRLIDMQTGKPLSGEAQP